MISGNVSDGKSDKFQKEQSSLQDEDTSSQGQDDTYLTCIYTSIESHKEIGNTK